jgi:hypothetical protein
VAVADRINLVSPFHLVNGSAGGFIARQRKKFSCPRLRQAQRVFPAPIIAEDSRPGKVTVFLPFLPAAPALSAVLSVFSRLSPVLLFFFYNPPFFLLSFLL